MIIKWQPIEVIKEKKEIKIFPSTLCDENGNKYLFRDDKPIYPTSVKVQDGVLRVEAQTVEEAINVAKKRLSKMDYSEDDINKIIVSASKGNAINNQPTFNLSADINKAQYLLVGIKIAYEFACEVFGLSYSNDKIGIQLRNELYKVSRMEKKSIPDKIDYKLIQKYASIATDASSIISNVIKSYSQEESFAIRHLCIIHDSKDHKLICQVILLCEPIFSFTVILSENATKYISNRGSKIAIVLKNGECYYF